MHTAFFLFLHRTVVSPRIIASSSVYFGAGHPLNRTEILYPGSEGYMPEYAQSAPRLSIINRRSLLRGLLQALVSVKDIYRVGRASTCLHICVSSQYLDLVWNTWLPDWEENGWPNRGEGGRGEEEEEEGRDLTEGARKRASSISTRNSGISRPSTNKRDRANSRLSFRRQSVASGADSIRSGISETSGMTGYSAMTGDGQLIFDEDSNKLINEDLLRKIAVFRRNFFKNTNTKGAAYVQLINYRHNPADNLAKESVKGASLDLTTQLPRAKSLSIFEGNGSIRNNSSDSLRPASLIGTSRSKKTSSLYSVASPTKKSSPMLASVQESREGIVPKAAPAIVPLVAAAPAVANKIKTKSNPTSTPAFKAAPAAADPPVEAQTSAPAVAAPNRKKPAQVRQKLSRFTESGYGTETDMDEFDDAASTFSEEEGEGASFPSAIAKIASIPTAVVAAGVAAVMAPSSEDTKLDSSKVANDALIVPSSEDTTGMVPSSSKLAKTTEPVASNRGSFAKETEAALAAVKVTTNGEVVKSVPVPKRASSNYGTNNKAVPVQEISSATEVQRKSSIRAQSNADVKREQSTRSRKSVSVDPAAATTTTNTTTRAVKREPSARSTTRRSSEAAKERRAVVASPPPPPPAPKQRGSFLSLGRKSKTPKSSSQIKRSSDEPYVPPMDRLIDYRPPQNRNLRNGGPKTSEEKKVITSSILSSPKEERPPPKTTQSVSRGGPFSFFRKRPSVQGVF